MRVPLLVALLLLAGCAGSSETCDDCLPGPDEGGEVVAANDTVSAPTWNVGDVFEQHMFFGREDTEGRHIKTVVVAAGRDGYQIATPDKEAARFESVYDYPILGRIGADLGTTAFGSDWSWMYDFPLRDNKTWTGSVDDLVNWNSLSFADFDLAFTCSFDPAIPTPIGAHPGFWIEARTGGELLIRYNYVPALRWFSHFWMYDLETPDEDIMFHAMSMGVSSNYTGEYHVSTAQTVVDHWFGVFPEPSGPVSGDPPAPEQFEIPPDEHLMGVAVPIAVGGRTEVHVVEPDGNDNVYAYQQNGMDGPGFDVHFIDKPGETGEWTWAVSQAGVATGSYTWLNRVATETLEL